jgi:predicted transcriptional regulator
MARPRSTQPTDGELEILNILWDAGPMELGAVRKTLQGQRPVATTTIATMLKLMLEKGLVERIDGPSAYLWSAKVSRQTARAGLLSKLLDLAFAGSARGLVAHMLEEGKLSDQDRQEIRRMLDTQAAAAGKRKKKEARP